VSGLQHHRCGPFDVALSHGSPALNTGGTGAKEFLPFTEGPMFGKRWRVNRFAQFWPYPSAPMGPDQRSQSPSAPGDDVTLEPCALCSMRDRVHPQRHRGRTCTVSRGRGHYAPTPLPTPCTGACSRAAPPVAAAVGAGCRRRDLPTLAHLALACEISPRTVEQLWAVTDGSKVTEAQMAALFDEGLHPNADAISEYLTTHGLHGLASIDATRLGRRFHIGKQDNDFRRATRR
jgi:hypothetical protein